MNIYQRINEVRKLVSYVQKSANVNNRYKGVTHDGVTASARDAMVEQGIIIVPSLKASEVKDTGTATKSGVPIIRYEATYDVSFINAEKPDEFISMFTEAHANDEGDKAPGKALSYAVKAALLKVLMLETGEDDESRIEARRALKNLEKQAQAIAKGIEEDNPELVESLWSTFSDEEKEQAWLAKTKGGFFGTKEKEYIRQTGYRIVNEDVTNELREAMASENLEDADVLATLSEFYSDERGTKEFESIDSLAIAYVRQAMKLITTKDAA